MRLIRIVSIVSLILSAILLRAQSPDERPRKEARELFERAMKEGNERANQVHDICQAAQLQPRERKYADDCSSYTARLNNDDTNSLDSAVKAYQKHDLDNAESLARQVSSLNPTLFAKARNLLETIRDNRSAGQSAEQVKEAWERGDFKAVMSLAQDMTTPTAKTAASIYVKDVEMYNKLINDAEKEKDTNPDGAKDLLGQAYMLNQKGPSDPRGKITEINNALAAKSNAKFFGSQPGGSKSNDSAGTTTNQADTARKVNALLVEARNAEKQGNPTVAIDDYAAVLKLQPDNQEALDKTRRSLAAVHLPKDLVGKTADSKQQSPVSSPTPVTIPSAAGSDLKSAIRFFYNAQFDDARTALMDYIESPQAAQNLGAADFYLGATLIQRSILRTPRAQWKGPPPDALIAFKDARKANYSPVRAYVSPALLKVWDSTGQ
jgi:hypothetical protein